MSSISFPNELSGRKEAIKNIVLGVGFKFDEEIRNTLFFTDQNDLIYGVGVGAGEDGFISVNFAVAADEPVDNAKRVAALNFVNSEYKVLKCYYQDISLVLASEFFASTEKDFSECFKYSISAILKAYSELEEKHPGAL